LNRDSDRWFLSSSSGRPNPQGSLGRPFRFDPEASCGAGAAPRGEVGIATSETASSGFRQSSTGSSEC
jgi:hypothetical protein